MILILRTDNPKAEVGLYEDQKQLAYKSWQAHRQLSETIHKTIKENLDSIQKDWSDITGIVYYKGPGSFTGLRIGAAVANAISETQKIPLVNQNGQNWIEDGLRALQNGQNEPAIPEYGSEPKVTTPKK